MGEKLLVRFGPEESFGQSCTPNYSLDQVDAPVVVVHIANKSKILHEDRERTIAG